MNIEPCQCKEPGYCKRFQRNMTPKLFRLCQTREDYRKLWEEKLEKRKRAVVDCVFQKNERGLWQCVRCGWIYPFDGVLPKRNCGRIDKVIESDSSILSSENVVQSSVPQKVKRYGKAVLRWVSAGRPVRSAEEVERIYEQYCKDCEYKREQRCILCGCNVSKSKMALTNKIKMATESCPKDFWISEISD